MVKRERSYNYTFTIHNQGAYDPAKKEQLLEYLRAEYTLTGYIIAQELYPNEDKTSLDYTKLGDSHLQGNLYFKNQVDKIPLLKYFQKKYIEVKTDAGASQRTQILPIKKGTSTQMDNYFKGDTKMGGDPHILTDMALRIQHMSDTRFNTEVRNAIQLHAERMNRRKFDIEHRKAVLDPHYDPHQWVYQPFQLPSGFRWLF